MAAKKVVMVTDGNGVAVQGALHPTLVKGVSAIGAVAVTAGPIVGEIVRLLATVDCHVRVSTDGQVAVSSDLFLPAKVPEYFNMKAGSRGAYISVIQDVGAGDLYFQVME